MFGGSIGKFSSIACLCIGVAPALSLLRFFSSPKHFPTRFNTPISPTIKITIPFRPESQQNLVIFPNYRKNNLPGELQLVVRT
jgi:hypothetical protein